MLNVKMSVAGLVVAVLAIGAAQAAQAPSTSKSRSVTARPHKVVHSPYARAAAAHASAPSPGNPIKGHSVNQHRHAVGKPH